ncbi:PLP-dependent aminotransferase family protein [Pseudomonas sp. PDM23]|uniref:aminotransferase-like domain-containing protein n=1 Tax=unclassified Pseudomonas TaxID=196821 RepID=UPI00177BF863|nr:MULTISPECIES: PLP-dependent aminotransferase family protein [unclassified Pseudomonas]MBD9574384.1 PLP-dependent aminotransferase family protein [Pseudomonas sp. PDM23]MBD9673238.1 PLP-dependent aminotransferase family protein [Pseudomonas sp. PDM21]
MAVKESIDTVSMLKNALSVPPGAKYKRLAKALEAGILSGDIGAGTKLLPQRILADRLGVTVGTISRAYAELERMGLVTARVGDGTFVRQSGQETLRSQGFRNFVDEIPEWYDMSRNMHIPGPEIYFLEESLRNLSGDTRKLHELMLYMPEAGAPRFRQAGAEWLSTDTFQAHPEQTLCVNGGQHGLICTLMALLRAGDTVVTEQLTYPGLISASRLLGIRLLGAAMDEEGLLPESLNELCQQHRVTALYCTPTLQNPTTATLSPPRREAIARICRQHNVLIIEDETHAVLVGGRALPLSHYAPERSILIGGLSKAVSAGLRVGYLHAPAALVSRIASAIRASCWMATPLAFELATQWIENGTARELRQQQVIEIRRRKELVEGMLARLNYRTHPQCPHFWIEVPEPWRASDIERDLRLKNLLIATAEAFAVGRAAVPQFVRASISNTTQDDRLLQSAFATLADALQADGPESEPGIAAQL